MIVHQAYRFAPNPAPVRALPAHRGAARFARASPRQLPLAEFRRWQEYKSRRRGTCAVVAWFPSSKTPLGSWCGEGRADAPEDPLHAGWWP
ncbi:hypothetical protein [Lentzea albidocapillata]|uniref:hypothetical protein n=1 Tax=Lentzea albidocapillata TaxID=40571 RepID=UPI000B7ECC15|nr:hypothetical protein [Lentzea albidocapillata]